MSAQYPHTHMYLGVYTYIYTYTHTYAHVCMCVSSAGITTASDIDKSKKKNHSCLLLLWDQLGSCLHSKISINVGHHARAAMTTICPQEMLTIADITCSDPVSRSPHPCHSLHHFSRLFLTSSENMICHGD